jgi:hypothetical protein
MCCDPNGNQNLDAFIGNQTTVNQSNKNNSGKEIDAIEENDFSLFGSALKGLFNKKQKDQKERVR